MSFETASIYEKIKIAADLIAEKAAEHSIAKPEIGIVLGSGLGSVADAVTDAITISYGDIPGFHQPSVEGHAGKLVLGKLYGVPAAILQGRFHFYEGYSMEQVVFPTRTLSRLGIETLLLTNAAGAVNTRFRPADIMLIEDHLNLMGENPLKGPNLSQLGPRFPDMSEAYHAGCLEVLKTSAKTANLEYHTGIYAGLLGPTYETPAEIRMYRTLGADAVGMSTVPETIAANHLGVRVAGISSITNLAAGLSPHRLTHEEVIDNSKIAAKKIGKLLEVAIPKLRSQKNGGLLK